MRPRGTIRSTHPLCVPKIRFCNIADEGRRGNHLWGAPHIHGELLKLGFTIAQSTVARYIYRGRPPSQGWRTFLTNHVYGIAAIDLFVLPTITFRLLYCLVILRHGRRLDVDCGCRSGLSAHRCEAFVIQGHSPFPVPNRSIDLL
jgi:hypothetical protein